jgi:hypothetical protein
VLVTVSRLHGRRIYDQGDAQTTDCHENVMSAVSNKCESFEQATAFDIGSDIERTLHGSKDDDQKLCDAKLHKNRVLCLILNYITTIKLMQLAPTSDVTFDSMKIILLYCHRQSIRVNESGRGLHLNFDCFDRHD